MRATNVIRDSPRWWPISNYAFLMSILDVDEAGPVAKWCSIRTNFPNDIPLRQNANCDYESCEQHTSSAKISSPSLCAGYADVTMSKHHKGRSLRILTACPWHVSLYSVMSRIRLDGLVATLGHNYLIQSRIRTKSRSIDHAELWNVITHAPGYYTIHIRRASITEGLIAIGAWPPKIEELLAYIESSMDFLTQVNTAISTLAQ